MKEGLVKDAYELVMKEIQAILSLSYVLMVGIGMLFNYHLYAEFGINIFDYADILDFLIAPFGDWAILIFTILSIIIPLLALTADHLWMSKYPNSYTRMSMGLDKKSWYNKFRFISFAFLFVAYVILAAGNYGKWMKKKIKGKSLSTITYMDNTTISGIIIGKSKEVVFLLQGDKVIAIPITTVVKQLEIGKIED